MITLLTSDGYLTAMGVLLIIELAELARRRFVRYRTHHRVPHRELRARRSRPSGQVRRGSAATTTSIEPQPEPGIPSALEVPADRTGKSGDAPKSAAAA